MPANIIDSHHNSIFFGFIYFFIHRSMKVKVSKSKLLEKSRLRQAQWAKLDEEWTKFVDETFPNIKKKRGRPTQALDIQGMLQSIQSLLKY